MFAEVAWRTMIGAESRPKAAAQRRAAPNGAALRGFVPSTSMAPLSRITNLLTLILQAMSSHKKCQG